MVAGIQHKQHESAVARLSEIEHLQPVVVFVGHYQSVQRVEADVARVVEVARLGALAAKAVQEHAHGVKHGHAVVAALGNVDVSVLADGHAKREV